MLKSLTARCSSSHRPAPDAAQGPAVSAFTARGAGRGAAAAPSFSPVFRRSAASCFFQGVCAQAKQTALAAPGQWCATRACATWDGGEGGRGAASSRPGGASPAPLAAAHAGAVGGSRPRKRMGRRRLGRRVQGGESFQPRRRSNSGCVREGGGRGGPPRETGGVTGTQQLKPREQGPAGPALLCRGTAGDLRSSPIRCGKRRERAAPPLLRACAGPFEGAGACGASQAPPSRAGGGLSPAGRAAAGEGLSVPGRAAGRGAGAWEPAKGRRGAQI
jgi:hypothetical protein